jgi:hypothetical protein
MTHAAFRIGLAFYTGTGIESSTACIRLESWDAAGMCTQDTVRAGWVEEPR